MRGRGAAVGTVIGVGFVTASLVAIVATAAWVSSGTGLLTTGGVARTTVTITLVATVLGAAVAGLVARRLLAPVTTNARVATAAGAAVHAVATALLLIFGGALASGLVVLIAGPITSVAAAFLVVRPSGHRRAGG